MATNMIQDGEVLTLTAGGGGVTSGDLVLVGALPVVALNTAASGESYDAATEGVFELPKTSAQAWTLGQRIYRNAGTGKCDNDSTTGPMVGIAAAVAANPSSTGYVLLTGAAPEFGEGNQGTVADLTDNSGGAAADGTIAVLTGVDGTGSNAAPLTATKDAIKELSTKINAILGALRGAGLIS